MSGYVPPRGDLEGGDFPSTTGQRIALAIVIAVVLGIAVYLGVR